MMTDTIIQPAIEYGWRATLHASDGHTLGDQEWFSEPLAREWVETMVRLWGDVTGVLYAKKNGGWARIDRARHKERVVGWETNEWNTGWVTSDGVLHRPTERHSDRSDLHSEGTGGQPQSTDGTVSRTPGTDAVPSEPRDSRRVGTGRFRLRRTRAAQRNRATVGYRAVVG